MFSLYKSKLLPSLLKRALKSLPNELIFPITTYLNSVSYEEILFVSMNVLESMFPVVDGKIVEEEESLSGSSVAFLKALTLVPTPCRFNRWRASYM